MSEPRSLPSLQHQDAEEEITESTDTITERSPTTAFDLGNRDETTISESMRSNDDDPSSGSTQTGPDPVDPHDFATSSYTEISFPSDPEDDIEPEEAFGPQEREPGMPDVKQLTSSIVSWTKEAIAAADDDNQCQKLVSFVADDFEKQLRISSTSPPSSETLPIISDSSATMTPDFAALQQIEAIALTLNSNIDQVIAGIDQSTHTISKLTVDCMKAYETCLTATAETVDSNIKSMYQLMAQVEELNKNMSSVHEVRQEVAQVKQLLDVFEKTVL